MNNRFTEDIPTAQAPYFGTYPDLIGSIVVTVLCLVGMVVTSWRLTVVLLLFLAAVALALLAILRRIERATRDLRKVESLFSSSLYEALYNYLPVKALKAEQWLGDRLTERARAARKEGNRLVGLGALLLPVITVGTQAAIVGMLLLGAVLVEQNRLTTSDMATFFLFLVYMITPLVGAAIALSAIKQGDVSSERLAALYDDMTPEDPEQLPAAEPLPAVAGFETTQELRTRDLIYSYPDGHTVTIADIELAGPGVVCLVGPNGAGKSTLLTLASGLRSPAAGTLAWNGRPAEVTRSGAVRQSVYLLPQARTVLSMSVRDNITMGSTVSDAEIWRLAQRLGIEALFERLPQGLDTVIGVKGVGLSEGQKQQLFVMHLLLARPPVALLDEFSSNLDSAVKARVADELEELGRTSLIVLVTHDQDVLSRFDRHVTLDGVLTPDGR